MGLRTLCLERLLLVAVLAAGLTPRAEAVSIVGEFTGNWNTPGPTATATFDLYFVKQTPAGAVNGIFDWTCTSGFACSGLEIVSGAVQPSGALAMSTTALVQPVVNLVAANYTATVTLDGQHITNGVTTGSVFAADRVASPIPPDLSVLGGVWAGTWQTPSGSARATFDLVFTNQTPDGAEFDLTGYFDWTCTFGLVCSGREEVAGTLLPDHSIQLATTALVSPFQNLVPDTYSLLLIGDGSQLIGLTGTNSLIRAQHVPEPATALLSMVALLSLWLVRASGYRTARRTAAAIRS